MCSQVAYTCVQPPPDRVYLRNNMDLSYEVTTAFDRHLFIHLISLSICLYMYSSVHTLDPQLVHGCGVFSAYQTYPKIIYATPM